MKAAAMASRREKIEEMLQERSDDPFLWYSLAMDCLSERGEVDLSRAVTALERTLSCDAGYVPAYLQLGMLHSREDRPTEAADVLRQGITTAKAAGDDHAISEMQAVLDSLPDDDG